MLEGWAQALAQQTSGFPGLRQPRADADRAGFEEAPAPQPRLRDGGVGVVFETGFQVPPVQPLQRLFRYLEGHTGRLALLAELAGSSPARRLFDDRSGKAGWGVIPVNEGLATEAVLDATRDIDTWEVHRILSAIHREDGNAHAAVQCVLPQICRAVEVLVAALRGGGRWFNLGAGTSGRIGALDAAEIPPTFGLPADRVQAVIAGGPGALQRAVEGAEDHPEPALAELEARGLCSDDVLVAISASGRTPFTLAGLRAARALGARSISITCNPASALAREAQIAIVPEVGAEVIAGSTRMKCGLAQKMVMHMLSTTVMVRLGYVSGNLMSHMRPGSSKLEDRALRIVMQVGGVDREAARALLLKSGGDLGEATRRLRSAPQR